MNIENPSPNGLSLIALKEYRFFRAKDPFYRRALYFEDNPDRVMGIHRRELSNGKYQYLNFGLVEAIDRETYNSYLQDGFMETMAINCLAYDIGDKKTKAMMRSNLFMLQRIVKEELTGIVSSMVGDSANSKPSEPANESEDRYMIVVTGGDDELHYAGDFDPDLFELMRTMLVQRFERIQNEDFSKSNIVKK